jgi:dihydroorotate dehydrogenase
MADLRTRYLGLELRSPLVASSSPLTGTLDGLARLEAAGAGAVVLPSLFEEDLPEAAPAAEAVPPAAAGAQAGYGAGPAAYLSLVEQAKRTLSIPVIASLNGVSVGGWVRYATRLEQAGADALELNVYYVSSRPGRSGSEVELRLPLRWIAILYRRFGVSLAASTGVHTATDVVKVLLAGADVAMTTSALLRNGPDHLRPLEVQLRDWMDRHGHQTLEQLRGRLSQRSVPDPVAFERANYIRTLASHPTPRTRR